MTEEKSFTVEHCAWKAVHIQKEGEPEIIEIYHSGTKLGELYEIRWKGGMYFCSEALRIWMDKWSAWECPYGTVFGSVQWKERIVHTIGRLEGKRLAETLTEFQKVDPVLLERAKRR